MSVIDLLSDPQWDKPFFKRLAHNDTGAAGGHQAGFVIPQSLRPFFPGLIGTTTAHQPTIEKYIFADLYVSSKFLSRIRTRYQYQTWKGERSPESRLTSNLGPIRDGAVGGDLLILQRSLADLDLYRLILVSQGSADYETLKGDVGAKNWGTFGSDIPVTQEQFDTAKHDESVRENEAFNLFEAGAATTTTQTLRVARSLAFRQTIQELYEGRCALCGGGLRVPNGPSELEAAHVVPRSRMGADDARNGIGLCRKHHWAFDNGLFGVGDDRIVLVTRPVLAVGENTELKQFVGRPIKEATNGALRVAPPAFQWHRENVMVKS